MSLHHFFALQLNTQPEREALLTIAMNMRAITSRKELNSRINWIHEKEPMVSSWDWATALLNEIRENYMEPSSVDVYSNPLADFFSNQLRKATGGKLTHLSLKRFNFHPGSWTTEELAMPHMRWIALLAKRVDALKDAGYTAIDNLALVHPLDGLTDEKAESLRKIWLEHDAAYISFRDAIDVYLKSCQYFTDDQTMTPAFSQKVKAYVLANKQQSESDLIYFLCSRYDIHHEHEAAVSRAVKELIVPN